jgi:hypothetical protein
MSLAESVVLTRNQVRDHALAKASPFVLRRQDLVEIPISLI